ncbi:MAG TPA: FUN14 domain-containing protein [Planctomycetota bacterium]
MSKPKDAERRGLTPLQLGLVALLSVTLLGSIFLRFRAERAPQDLPPGAHGLVGDEGAPAAEPTPLERALPYLTEGSLFGLIGFALGYASRKFVKLALILLALFFVGLQALVWTGSASIDWSGLLGKLNALVFNLQENESMSAFLTRRIPAGGGMLLGYWIGFQRG